MTAIDTEMLERHRREAMERVNKIGDEIRLLKRQCEQCKGLVSFASHLLAVLEGDPSASAKMNEAQQDWEYLQRAPTGAEEDAAAMASVEGEPGDNAGTDGF